MYLCMHAYVCVMSRKSRSAVKKKKIIKLHFVNYLIGQLYDHVTLAI